ncbi:hypothetical protein [Halobacillus salinus]|uniref:Uncharacterized protein n=1 Tax=Halobacillus salinus TaxID=192814 RepID=A0A4Z0H0P1_9BACI|nr:hypothetical protein [Halobacillus salinus]TGB03539.1 hypothetical protein E4663_00605 [Halobacillus salinus]
MTSRHFVGANIELPIGTFGRNPTYKRLSELNLNGTSLDKYLKNEEASKFVEVYETEEDASGIDVFNIVSGYELIRTQFTTPYVYEVQGALEANNTLAQRKSIKSLFSYIDEHLLKGDFIEVYSCRHGHEGKEKDDSMGTYINLSTLQFGNHIRMRDLNHLGQTFFLEDRQYVLVKK